MAVVGDYFDICHLFTGFFALAKKYDFFVGFIRPLLIEVFGVDFFVSPSGDFFDDFVAEIASHFGIFAGDYFVFDFFDSHFIFSFQGVFLSLSIYYYTYFSGKCNRQDHQILTCIFVYFDD